VRCSVALRSERSSRARTGRRGPCHTRARSSGEPRGTAGYRTVVLQGTTALSRRSGRQSWPEDTSFPSSGHGLAARSVIDWGQRPSHVEGSHRSTDH
jgi:hypothetical protein